MNDLSRRQAIERRDLAAVVFAGSATAMLLCLLLGTKGLPIHPVTSAGFFDLKIYRESARVVLSGLPLYAAKFQMGYGFTYPPAAALLFLPLTVCPLSVDEVVVSLLNVALVVVIVRCTLRLRPLVPEDAASLAREQMVAWLTSALALWLEPIMSALGYGQIDLLIAALVLVDLTWGSEWRGSGIGIGVAAALKLTPLIFIPYLALSGRGRMAGRSLATFAASIVAVFVLVPGDAAAYWGRALFELKRVTGHGRFAGRGPANQSLRGALLRLAAGTPHLTVIWICACVAVAALGLSLAVRAGRRGDEAWGFMLAAITGLLICPVSWTHHWCIAVPGVILLLSAPQTTLRGRLLKPAIVLASLGAVSIWALIVNDPNGRRLGIAGLLLGDIYVLAGLGTIAVAGLLELRRAGSRGAAGRLAAAAPHHGAALGLSPGHPGEGLRAIPGSQAALLDRESVR